MADQPDEPVNLTDLPLSSRSNVPMEVQDATASTSATPFAGPTIAAPKSNAQRQREYRQRIAASRTSAQATAARKLNTERRQKSRLRTAANLALASGSLESNTASSSRSGERPSNVRTGTQQRHTMSHQPDEPVDLTDLPLPSTSNVSMEVQDAAASTSTIRTEYIRLRGHALRTITEKTIKFCDDGNNAGQTIVTNLNSQSLTAHSGDIETDTVIQRSDYLVLTETWMRDTCDPVSINNYECVARQNNRSDSDTNAAGGVAIYRKLSSRSTANV